MPYAVSPVLAVARIIQDMMSPPLQHERGLGWIDVHAGKWLLIRVRQQVVVCGVLITLG